LAAQEVGTGPLPVAYEVAAALKRRYGVTLIDAPVLSAPTGDLVL
jgi:hypothetical protein